MMDKLIIEDNIKKWLDKLINYDQRTLVTLNWKDNFKRFKEILTSIKTDYELKINCFIFLTKIIKMPFIKTDTEIKSYFNDLVPIFFDYSTHPNVFYFF